MQKDNIPNHIAIIPDGNRRWAKKRGLKAWDGHEAGAKNIEKLFLFALKNGIKCLSFWGSSLDNMTRRPLLERKALLDIYKRYFQNLIDGKEIYDEEVRINVIGRWEEQFPESLKKIIREAIQRTKKYKKRVLNFLLAYNGTDEMVYAVQNILSQAPARKKITLELIKENLMTRDCPPVDLVIRTGGDPHLSAGFMMWDIADAQLYFSDENFPDFSEKKFEEALKDFSNRKRRFGK